jgi:cytochrome c-type biogenesis protein CcmH/NrfF
MTTESSDLGHTRRTFLLKIGHSIEIGLATFLTPLFSCTDETQQTGVQLNALSARQEIVAKRLERKLIAPCCFSQTVANHYSDVAAHMKQQIRQLLAQGHTEEQILDAYVRVYGERILAEPRTSGFNLLAYLTPPTECGNKWTRQA